MSLRSVLLVEEHPATSYGGVALRNAAAAYALARLGPLAIVDAGAATGELGTSGLGEVRAVGLGQPPTGDPDHLLRAGGHPSDARWLAAADARWNSLLDQLRPDVVVIEQLWLHAAVSGARRVGARVVLDAHNVEAEVYAAIAATGPSGRAVLDRAMAGRTAVLERRVARCVDQVWACSTHDQEAFAALGAAAVAVPNVVDVARTQLRDRHLRRPLLLFPASLAYPPNIRAARTLVEQVLPDWDGELALVGHSPPRWLQEVAAAEPRLLVPGRVESLRPFLDQACAVVVPLTEGGGTRFKVLEAMAAGVPVISTAKGVEGLAVRHGEHFLQAEQPAELLAAARRLCQHDDQALVLRARQLVTERYSWQVAAAAVQAALG